MTPEKLQQAKRLSKLQQVLIKRWHLVTKQLHIVLDTDPEYLEMRRTGIMPQWLVNNLEHFPGYGAYYRRPGEAASEPYIKPRPTSHSEPATKAPEKQNAVGGLVEMMLKSVGASNTIADMLGHKTEIPQKNTDPFSKK